LNYTKTLSQIFDKDIIKLTSKSKELNTDTTKGRN